MHCKTPRNLGARYVGCGKCEACRARRADRWILRMMLEICDADHAAFVTWTYADDPGSLDYSHMQEMWKRLRSKTGCQLRFFCVGEYGSKNGRAHWHTVQVTRGEMPTEGAMELAWKRGFVVVDPRPVTAKTCRYSVKYLHKPPSDERSVIAKMSLRPGLGTAKLFEYGQWYAREGGRVIPPYLRVGKKRLYMDETCKLWFSLGMREVTGVHGTRYANISNSEYMEKTLYETIRNGVNRKDPFFLGLLAGKKRPYG